MKKVLEKLEALDRKLTATLLMNKEFLDLKEAAIYLNLSRSALYKITSNRAISFYQPGGKKIFFKREELDQWILSGNNENKADLDHIFSKSLKSKL